MSGELWIGLRHIHQLTSRREYRLRVELEDWDGRWFHADYDTFSIADETDNYRRRPHPDTFMHVFEQRNNVTAMAAE